METDRVTGTAKHLFCMQFMSMQYSVQKIQGSFL